ncbi:MAG: hypothetical protein HXY20_09670 [Acidobacteria bacterium]|nr:hypothetical protein [Acidobacteriota bacterium]
MPKVSDIGGLRVHVFVLFAVDTDGNLMEAASAKSARGSPLAIIEQVVELTGIADTR